MIFVTVGTQLAFDRLIAATDVWAGQNREVAVFAQIGPGTYHPKNCEFATFVPPDKANQLFSEADLIVSHAGMGSILTALKYRKPILILPRRATLGEHRNEHQLATAKWLGNKSGVFVAESVDDIGEILGEWGNLNSGDPINEFADPRLISHLRNCIDGV